MRELAVSLLNLLSAQEMKDIRSCNPLLQVSEVWMISSDLQFCLAVSVESCRRQTIPFFLTNTDSKNWICVRWNTSRTSEITLRPALSHDTHTDSHSPPPPDCLRCHETVSWSLFPAATGLWATPAVTASDWTPTRWGWGWAPGCSRYCRCTCQRQ